MLSGLSKAETPAAKRRPRAVVTVAVFIVEVL
jgi:hypothetical protein